MALQVGRLPVGPAALERAIAFHARALQVWGRKVGDAGITPVCAGFESSGRCVKRCHGRPLPACDVSAADRSCNRWWAGPSQATGNWFLACR